MTIFTMDVTQAGSRMNRSRVHRMYTEGQATIDMKRKRVVYTNPIGAEPPLALPSIYISDTLLVAHGRKGHRWFRSSLSISTNDPKAPFYTISFEQQIINLPRKFY
ncbi:hypothetical protein CDAR_558071 [Caerostris darwini]|uniref:Uncharacterized protein n=1 Tax=Caerostris darwini TaxID=1538125 RepID=A0AAV4R9H9_9ARAC|nr:hypothetical protein CDAR_558071 [Caerostris darwini]